MKDYRQLMSIERGKLFFARDEPPTIQFPARSFKYPYIQVTLSRRGRIIYTHVCVYICVCAYIKQ